MLTLNTRLNQVKTSKDLLSPFSRHIISKPNPIKIYNVAKEIIRSEKIIFLLLYAYFTLWRWRDILLQPPKSVYFRFGKFIAKKEGNRPPIIIITLSRGGGKEKEIFSTKCIRNGNGNFDFESVGENLQGWIIIII